MANRAGQNRERGQRSTDGESQTPRPMRTISARDRRALDWFVFFVADIQTGFGAFVAVFLTTQKWTQVDIGIILTVSGVVSLVGQIPFGALVDAVRSVRATAALALVAIGVSAFAFAAWPIFPIVFASRLLHAAASCVLGFALVSLSLRLTGPGGASERLGRNAAFASAGTGIAAAIMGVCGQYLSERAVFFLAASLVAPALFALSQIKTYEPHAAPKSQSTTTTDLVDGLLGLARNRPLLIFAVCISLFHLANAAMLPLAASMVTLRSSEAATIMVAAAMIVPQLTVTILSPSIGRGAQRWGRRPFLLLGFSTLLFRGLLFAIVTEPQLIVLVQILDGISAAVLGVLVPLTIADLTRNGGHFNLAQGTVGCAMGIGAAISTVAAGYIADNYGSYLAFVILAVISGIGLLALAAAMPETRPEPSGVKEAETEAV